MTQVRYGYLCPSKDMFFRYGSVGRCFCAKAVYKEKFKLWVC